MSAFGIGFFAGWLPADLGRVGSRTLRKNDKVCLTGSAYAPDDGNCFFGKKEHPVSGAPFLCMKLFWP